ncbi:hypothetical protein, partial [uncultured Cetobacterium sp.]|uniref:hypothetical protein n=1 Tax=uncultured Cetobacterium sp. TaxID=527638 RepID=UPI002619A1F8
MKKTVFICVFILSSVLTFALESFKVNNGEYLVDLNTLLIEWKALDEEIITLSSAQEYSKVNIL